MKEIDPERLEMLYDRFCDVCLVEKEVWTEIYMPRQVEKGLIMTNVQEKYEVVIDSEDVEDTLEVNIPLGKAALKAACRTKQLDEINQAIRTATRSVVKTDADMKAAVELVRVINQLEAAQKKNDPGCRSVDIVLADGIPCRSPCSCHG